METTLTTNLVIGLGQIGSAIQNILGADGHDIYKYAPRPKEQYDVLHICIPYTPAFESSVDVYRHTFNPKLIIIHSTVPVGTSNKLNAVHSPCRGIHPNLEEGIRTFTKFFGGKDAQIASEIFSKLGIPVQVTEDSDTTEALKLWDTTIYGWNIILQKEIKNYCDENKLDFNLIYTEANRTYNEGYEKLGHPEYKKYILKNYPGKIGGHCVIQNLPLLKGLVPETIQKYNAKLK